MLSLINSTIISHPSTFINDKRLIINNIHVAFWKKFVALYTGIMKSVSKKHCVGSPGFCATIAMEKKVAFLTFRANERGQVVVAEEAIPVCGKPHPCGLIDYPHSSRCVVQNTRDFPEQKHDSSHRSRTEGQYHSYYGQNIVRGNIVRAGKIYV